MTAKALPPALRFVSPRELAERLEAERRGTPFLLYLDESASSTSSSSCRDKR